MAKPPVDQPAPLPDADTTTTLPLPSEHVAHAKVFANELNLRMSGFQAGAMALRAEIDSRQAKYTAERDALDAAHKKDMLSLAARVADMERGEAMAAAALAVVERETQQGEVAADQA